MAKKKKRKTNQGVFTVKKSGSIEYRFYYRDECGELKRKAVTGENKTACLRKADEWRELIERRRRGIETDATIVSLLEHKFRSDFEKHYMEEMGYARNMDSLKIIQKSSIGGMPIAKIRPMHMELFLRSITTYSNSVIQKIHRQVRLAFSLAQERGIIEKNIMLSKDMKCPKSCKEDKEVKALTVEEQRRFVEVLETDRPPNGRNDYRLQLFIEMYSGLRMGEINALHEEDVDLDNNVIHVRGTIARGADYRSFVRQGAKTRTGVRDVPISKKLRPYLEQAIKNKKRNPQGLLFYDHLNKRVISTSQVNNYFHRACKKAEVEERGQHALRHTFATRCIESGIPAVVLKNWLGHKDIHMTLDIYADVFSSLNDGAVDKFDSYVDSM